MPDYAPTMADLAALCYEEPATPATGEDLKEVTALIARTPLLRLE